MILCMTAILERLQHPTARADSAAGDGRTDRRPTANQARGTGVILVGILLIAGNLRLGVSATGSLLDSLTADLHLGSATASFLTSIWALAFAVGGITGSWLARRYGVSHILTASIVILIAGSALRAIPDTAALLGGSILAGLGIALANVLLPAAVRQYFPERIGLVTGLYATTLAAGSALAAGISVPLAGHLGTPELGLAVWALPALLALAVWSAARGQRAAHRVAADRAAIPVQHLPLRALTRSKLAWAMAALFGLQSMSAYVVMGWLPSILEDAGMSAVRAGTTLSIVFVISIPFSFVVPVLGARMRDQRILLLALSASLGAAFVGLIADPTALIWLWAALFGLGLSVFPMVLALFSIRGGSATGTAALSTFSQSIGYLIAAVAPLAVGILHATTGSWALPLAIMAAVALCQGVVSLYVASGRRSAVA
jgi:MFS transporter, CP family, cyanate transporter